MIGYFGVPGLAKMYGDNRIEYFESVMGHVACTHSDVVDGDRIGVMGVSKGGDLALSCAAFLGDKVKACAVQNSCVSSIITRTTYGDKVVETLPWADMDKLIVRSVLRVVIY